jgi:hypothetical protein
MAERAVARGEIAPLADRASLASDLRAWISSGDSSAIGMRDGGASISAASRNASSTRSHPCIATSNGR